MEYTRDFKITIEIYKDTNKQTFRDREEFESYTEAIEYLEDLNNKDD